MNEEELYKLAISDVPKYSLLNEILAIRDNRFPNEEVDYCINVNGYISLDVLNKYVRNINELEQLQNNWNELKEIEKEHQKINGELREENKKLKEVIEEVKEYIESNCESFYVDEPHYRDLITIDSIDILKILDKAKGE